MCSSTHGYLGTNARNSAAYFGENGMILISCPLQFLNLDILLTLHYMYYVYKTFITLTRSTCNSKSMSSFDLTVFFQCSFAEMNRKPLGLL